MAVANAAAYQMIGLDQIRPSPLNPRKHFDPAKLKKEAAEAKKPAASAGQCRVCGCTAGDCRLCVERTGEPCQWVTAAKNLCKACLPLLEHEVTVLTSRSRIRELLDTAGIRTIGQVWRHTKPPHQVFTAKLWSELLAAADRWIKARLKETDSGDELPDMEGELAPEEEGAPA